MSCHPRLATNSRLLPNPDHAPCSSPSSAGTDVQATARDASIVASHAPSLPATTIQSATVRSFSSELLGDRNPFAAKLATKHVGMNWVGKAPNHVFPHSRLSRQLVRSIGHFTRAAKLVHMVEHGTPRARRNLDQDSVWKIPADPQHTAYHWSDAPVTPRRKGAGQPV